ncbi:MAG: ATP-binding domain-containing protein [Pelatocladus maniniholoensis HA4357-MV3]|uniref:ATP-binding domain-containing protein n=1 Tax=Pelatocladus maniniholoensis HA4357-MV3 TaxID=1117104 RepID=A0A9E3HDB1_9NOST|nr:ATP-binding domain-containing protein [Pelatocladus maniniholoensis HA4357-MV3]
MPLLYSSHIAFADSIRSDSAHTPIKNGVSCCGYQKESKTAAAISIRSISIHKSQGSQYPVVVLPLYMQPTFRTLNVA